MSNVFSFTGAIGRDAEVRSTPSGQTVCNVAVACNVGFGDRQQTMWIRVALWGKRAEGQLVNYLKKGQQVFVSGELSQSEYQANDGTTKTNLELNATVVDLIGKKADGGQQSQQRNNQPQQQQPQNNQQQQQGNNSGQAEYDSDIPF